MRWPWQRPERRQSFSSQVLNAFLAEAETAQANSTATGAVEACAALYAAGFAAARVEMQEYPKGVLSPHTRALIARNLIRRGEDVHRIAVQGGQLRLLPAGQHHVHGSGVDEADWIYHVTRFGPSGSVSGQVSSAGVTHCRYAIAPERPWVGISPLGFAYGDREADRTPGDLAGE